VLDALIQMTTSSSVKGSASRSPTAAVVALASRAMAHKDGLGVVRENWRERSSVCWSATMNRASTMARPRPAAHRGGSEAAFGALDPVQDVSRGRGNRGRGP
jgi:hypothetical protein